MNKQNILNTEYKKNISFKIKEFFSNIWNMFTFMLLLVVYLVSKGLSYVFQGKYVPQKIKMNITKPFSYPYAKIVTFLSPHREGAISQVELVELSFRNMQAKKARTWVTIGGMSIGIGVIVFLVSIGYGLQDLVIKRVARLEEMRQADVSPQTGGKIKIADETLTRLKQIPNLESALPLIAVVGNVSYKNSSSAMVVYGVTTEYLQQSAIKPIYGNYFDSNELSSVLGNVVKKATLGATTSNQANTDPSINWVDIPSESDVSTAPGTKVVELSVSAKKEAVVNTAMLKVLGINEAEAVGTVFSSSFVIVGDLLPDQGARIESKGADYKIVGVISDEKIPLFYIPFVDLKSLGITNYSQVKISVNDTANLAKARQQIESMGFVTRSVTDTVSQINSLFDTAKLFLGLLGMVALAVAALGMFNTLTVSLLERTREVGLMKAMGMRSAEVQELFLSESMLMGFFGGVLGILLGGAAGKLLGVILSFFTVSKGAGIVDVSSIPLTLILIVMLLSFVVGIVTGIFPARRATKISALNALRYE